MPGPAHSGVAYVETWRPGTGAAGATQIIEIGGFSTDMLLTGVLVDATASACNVTGDARVTITIQSAMSAAIYNVLQAVPSDSAVLMPDYDVCELGVVLPAGAKLRVSIQHAAGGDNVPLIFLWSSP